SPPPSESPMTSMPSYSASNSQPTDSSTESSESSTSTSTSSYSSPSTTTSKAPIEYIGGWVPSNSNSGRTKTVVIVTTITDSGNSYNTQYYDGNSNMNTSSKVANYNGNGPYGSYTKPITLLPTTTAGRVKSVTSVVIVTEGYGGYDDGNNSGDYNGNYTDDNSGNGYNYDSENSAYGGSGNYNNQDNDYMMF
ncbi:hypothetical protein AYI68_g4092, partial [Smittium mucronatum]